MKDNKNNEINTRGKSNNKKLIYDKTNKTNITIKKDDLKIKRIENKIPES